MDAEIDVQSDVSEVGAPRVTVRYWAGARAAAGVESELFTASSLMKLREQAVERHPALESVLPLCSFLVDGVRMDADDALSDGVVVEALPPFAGG